ncbi:MAG: low-specificity L-threonine aldolase [Dehalococcoidia bacterium]|nr:low-specificity L-threonine aldolase [Dehalococcoidia bacterium]
MPVIDLRSDTVTKPTEEMRAAMAQAEVGDDVMGEDPTVNRLEQMAAELLGKEAGLLTSSGTMSNLIAALSHCRRGDEVIMGSEGHMFWNEVAGAATLAAVQVRTVPNDSQGRMDPGDVEASIRPPGNIHFPRTSLLCLENTHNRCNGGVLTPEDTRSVSEVAHANGVAVHLDGARVFNAAVALEVPAKDLVADVDDVSFCLSKGLSAPVGSVLCGSQEFVEQARKWRKMLGGGMRQAGVIAAAGVVALETMVDRLAEDHSNASRLASGLSQVPGIRLDPGSFQTNIVFLELEAELGSVHEFISRLNQHGLKVSYPGGRRIRLVTHRHISPGDVEQAVDIVAKVAREQRKPAA